MDIKPSDHSKVFFIAIRQRENRQSGRLHYHSYFKQALLTDWPDMLIWGRYEFSEPVPAFFRSNCMFLYIEGGPLVGFMPFQNT
jgi:hypothetical protein